MLGLNLTRGFIVARGRLELRGGVRAMRREDCAEEDLIAGHRAAIALSEKELGATMAMAMANAGMVAAQGALQIDGAAGGESNAQLRDGVDRVRERANDA